MRQKTKINVCSDEIPKINEDGVTKIHASSLKNDKALKDDNIIVEITEEAKEVLIPKLIHFSL